MFISSGRVRARTVPGPNIFIQEERQNVSTKVYSLNWPKVAFATGGTQITESDGNQWPPPKGRPLEDHGSEFFTQKTEVVTGKFPYSVVNYVEPGFVNKLRTSGNLFIANIFETVATPSSGYTGHVKQPLKVTFPPDLSSDRNALNVKGAIAIAACNPGNQIAQTASALAELLRDMPRIPGLALWESKLRAIATLGAAGEEFLNYIFGIAPTLGDMGTFLKAVHKFDRVVDQFERDSGRVVRRKFVFPKERTETTEVLSDRYSPLGTYRSNAEGFPDEDHVAGNDFSPSYGISHPAFETIRTRVTEREISFSGAFTYHLPGGYDTHAIGDRRALTAKLFGAEPDLNTLWQLAPWSWAVDWFVDAGALIKNLQSHISYGTVLRYGYLMEKTTTTDTYTAGKKISGTLKSDVASGIPAPYPAISPVTLRITTKKRIKANPFGFGVSWDGLSTIQQAIVAALGITRVVR
uniref:Uncharacterized protein n=1 Tax=Leviviridae sp. TaxID=2027243 RepID=A0A514D0J4_9VIRU|nr:MAG: hypothetical protein H3BulkLitter171098_000001 [Leviviridae sp.]